MSVTPEQRIQLAEAMGWKSTSFGWAHPVSKIEYENLPDPENDANDTEAVIRWLKKTIVREVEINHRDGSMTTVKFRFYEKPRSSISWQGNNWKQGVCELAMKVIDSDS